MRRRMTASLAGTFLVASTVVVLGGPATAAGNTLTVNVSTIVRPVTQVGSGGLYAVSSGTQPTTSQLLPLNINSFTQPPPGTTQLGNGATKPCCDALSVAGNITSAGGQQFIRMPDIYPTFPYQWVGWPDWEQKVQTMVEARLAATSTTNIMGWELWNEPDWTWDSDAGTFADGWTRTYRLIRSLDSATPIVGPSVSYYNHNSMLAFMTNAKNTDTLPDVIVWHELGDTNWNDFDEHVADYRAVEASLGISPRPISINEYNSKKEMDIPSVAVHWISVFERYGARDAQRAYWFEAGTFNGLFTVADSQPTASYWAYRWYGEMAGNIVQTVPQSGLDGVASYDSSRKIVNVVLGGDGGDNTVKLTGLSSFGSQVSVAVRSTPNTGRSTAVTASTAMSTATLPVSNGTVTVPVSGMTAESAYQVVVTPVAGPATTWQQVYEAENATVVNAVTRASTGASNGYYVGGIDGSADMRSDSFVDFAVNVPQARSYTMAIRYANGTGATSTQGLAYNGGGWSTVSYPATAGWAQFGTTNVTVKLSAGYNVIRLAKGSPNFSGGGWSTVSYPATAGWAQFGTTNVTVKLSAGYNVIRLAKGSPNFSGGVGYAELDSITLS